MEPPCLLEYSFTTVPSPLQCSTDTAASAGTIEVAIAPPSGKTIYCRWLEFAIPVGGEEEDFSTTEPTVTPNTAWWTRAGRRIESGAALGLDPTLNYHVEVFTSTSAHWQIDYPLSFEIEAAAVSPTPGTFKLYIGEHSGTVDEPAQLTPHSSLFPLTKVPARLQLGNFVAVAAGSSSTTQPRGEFAPGEAIELIWASNAERLELWAGAEAQPLWSGDGNTWTLSGGRSEDTTFTLLATLGGETRAATFTVTVPTPSIVAASVESGAARTGSATLKGNLEAKGSTTLTTAEASALSLSSLSALRARTIPERVTLVAHTDTLVLATATAPDNAQQCACLIGGETIGGARVQTRAGYLQIWKGSKGSQTIKILSHSFLLPVASGESFNVWVEQWSGNKQPVGVSLFAFALGAADGLEAIATAGSNDAALDPPPIPPPSEIRRVPTADRIAALAAAVAELLGDRVTESTLGRFAAVLERNVVDSPESQPKGDRE